MTLTKKKKSYGCVLMLAVLGFIIDRCFFSPPAASASLLVKPTAMLAPQLPATKPPTAKPAAAPADDLHDFSDLSERLRHAAAAAPQRDPFAPTGVWLDRIERKSREGKPTPVDEFQKRHHLTAIMIGGHANIAIIDGKPVEPGQSVDGFRLTTLHNQSAEFESSGDKVILKLPIPGEAATVPHPSR